jgi:serine/threonine protein kinase
MLNFNPNQRITAEEAIKDSYFDDIRLPDQETSADVDPINLEFDRDNTESLSLEALRELLLKEIK